MRKPTHTRQFERDLRLQQRRGKDMSKLKQVLAALINEKVLADQYVDHSLKGNYKNRRECHLEPDRLLIYKLNDDEIIYSRSDSRIWRSSWRLDSGKLFEISCSSA